ncbi:GNAT family N-acetyltransferase [Fulvimarina sp. MAC8]|uniref:GNAT family N-acetyltransferase n=1 Tax=Fulvimarina sp. MAC8 TaxID=3162874 RepID=UPI0032EEA944
MINDRLPEPGLAIVIGPTDPAAVCRKVLEGLPEWFGDPSAIERYALEARNSPSIALVDDENEVGFVVLKWHGLETVELHSLGLLREYHRQGHGRRLLATAEGYARVNGAKFLTVKTLGPSKQDPAYAATLSFYLAFGFTPLEEFMTLWREPPNPCLFLAKAL